MISACTRASQTAAIAFRAYSPNTTLLKQIGLNPLVERVCKTQRSFIYDDAFFKIDDFTKTAALMRKNYMFTLTNVRNQLQKSLEDVVRSEARQDDRDSDQSNLRKLFYLATDSDDDYRLMINIIKRNMSSKGFTENQIRSFVIILMRAIYANDKVNIGLELLEDEEFKSYMLGTYSALFVLNKLLVLERYDEVVKYFEKEIPYFSKNSFSIKTPVVFRQPWPIDHIDLAIEALFKMNTPDALSKLKSYVEICQGNQSRFSKHAVVRSFLLAIRQNDPEFALKMARNFVFPVDLKINLEVIALARLNRLNEALSMSNEIFNVAFEANQTFVGRVYPMTVRSLKEATEQSKDSLQYMSYFEKFWQRVQRDKRLANFDLNTYVDAAGYKAVAGNQDRMKFKNLDSKIRKVNAASTPSSSSSTTPTTPTTTPIPTPSNST